MRILGIETSCDETSAAIVQDGTHVLSNAITSSKDLFAKLGGVIPEEAARKQVECMIPIINHALEDANMQPKDIDTIAVTTVPGLLGSLLVGTTTARTLASVWGKNLIEVDHTFGHLSSVWLDRGEDGSGSGSGSRPPTPQFPTLALSVSGGHTELWYRESRTKGTCIGRTRDDAAGEAFDKGASLLGLGYPGGPAIAKEAEHGDPRAYNFPLPLKGEPTLDFSFSGLKTSLKYLIKDHQFNFFERKAAPKHSKTTSKISSPDIPLSPLKKNESIKKEKENIAASYQHTICTHLTHRIKKALDQYPDIKEVHLVGGVSANSHLREMIKNECPDIKLLTPIKMSYCTDNAAMIAAAGYFMAQS
jgi:N6-L-threonylcarbamoyladenine synthase